MQKLLTLTTVCFLFILLSLNGISQPQPPAPTPFGGTSVSGTGPVGGGAPVGSGVIFLLVMSAAYGAKKVFDIRKRIIE